MKDFMYLDETVTLHITEDTCIGCGNCELVCPHRVLKVIDAKAKILDRGCMECGACARNCPVEAIYVNPDEGCGCAAYIINSWFSKFRKKPMTNCGC